MKKYNSPALQHIHEEATDLFNAGMITSREMKAFDKDCLVQEENPVQSISRTNTAALAAPRNRK